AGRARFGPDVEWLEQWDFNVHPGRSAAFFAAIPPHWPTPQEGAPQPPDPGMRARVYWPGGGPPGFPHQWVAQHGVRGVLNLFGIESPGLTASLALASEAVSRIG